MFQKIRYNRFNIMKNNLSAKLKAKIQTLPNTPGVYFFKDSDNKIIYIGKASKLKRRVSSYFTKTHNDYKTPLLVDRIADVEWLELGSEVEALFMEAELIKRHKPLYNVRERDDKNFIFIRVSLQDDFPVVGLVRRPDDDKARYFGPFAQSYGVKQALKYLRRIFPYFVKPERRFSSKLEYQIGVLPKPDVTRSEYRKQIRKLVMVLEGKSTILVKDLERQIARLSKQKDYEAAIALRDQYLALKALNSRVVFGDSEQLNLNLDVALRDLAIALELTKPPARIECYDISNFSGKDSVSSMVVFTNGVPDRQAYRHFKMRTKGPNDFAMMQETLTRRFGDRNDTWPKPDLIVIDGGKGQLSSVKKVMDDLNISIRTVGLAKRYETVVVDAKDIKGKELRREGEFFMISFEHDTPVLQLLQRIRDEAHRFAVAYHTNVRSKRVKSSELDTVPGIGPVTRKKLVRTFGSVAGVKVASIDELSNVVGAAKAKVIRQHLL